MYCESLEIPPGEVAQMICVVPRRRRLTGVFMDPPTAAAFTIERIEVLTPGEMHVLSGMLTPGALIAVRNGSIHPARFRAELECPPDVDQLERELEVIVDRDWRAAYDRAKARRD
jgi:hypothetical protein